MKKSTNLEKKIAAYSSIALCFAGATVVNGQIIYTDVNPDVVLTANGDSIIIDFNNDASGDYVIRRFDWNGVATNTAVIMAPTTLNAALGTMGTILPYLSALNAGNLIDAANVNWIVDSGTSSQTKKMALASVYSGVNYGNFGDNADHFIGCKFLVGANTYYGWIRTTAIPADGSTATVVDYAYNSTPDASIDAGEGPAGINDLEVLDAQVFAFDKKLHVNLSQNTEGTISVYNSLGEIVLTEKINGLNSVLDVQTFSEGIYLIKVEAYNSAYMKKIKI